ncbi:ankyrin repeat-containing domain protein [Absidia repens]|uniref:Ankyrin repeat-containing domain protein n=1 Tax=Absidia repens TaxID=90262 RepID=A0A1X2IXP8_9FUNG|nr:ankyrin repeat-containing domain protein [Absidia repens]
MDTVTLLPGTGHHPSQEPSSRFNNNGLHHAKQKCTSATCCSPSRIWRSIQQFIGEGNKQDLIKLCQDPNRSSHVLRVLLTSRLTNDASLYPASNKHRVVQLSTDDSCGISSLLFRSKVNATFGKSATDLNALQLALFHRQEGIAYYLLQLVRQHASDKETGLFVNHLWGTRNGSLHLACFLGMPRVVQLLLEMGVVPDAVNGKLKMPLDCCLAMENSGRQSASLMDCRTLIERALDIKNGKKLSVDASSLSASTSVETLERAGGGGGGPTSLDTSSSGGDVGGGDTDSLSEQRKDLNTVSPRQHETHDRTSTMVKPASKSIVKGVCPPLRRGVMVPPPPSILSHWPVDSYVQVHSIADGDGCLMDSSPAFMYRHEQQSKQRQPCYGLDSLQSMTLEYVSWSSPLLPVDGVLCGDGGGNPASNLCPLDDDLDQDALSLRGGAMSSVKKLDYDSNKQDPGISDNDGVHSLNGMEAMMTRSDTGDDTYGATDKTSTTTGVGDEMAPSQGINDGGGSYSFAKPSSLSSGTAGGGNEDGDDDDVNRRKHKHHRHRVHFDPKVVLMEACIRGDLQEVDQVIMQQQADTSWLLSDHYGGAGFQDRTLLQLALMHGHESLVHYLVKKVKVNINQVDADGWTALHYAAALGQWKNMEYLASSDLINLFAETDDGFLIQDCPSTEMERFRCRLVIARALRKLARSTQFSGTKCTSAAHSRLGILVDALYSTVLSYEILGEKKYANSALNGF